MTTRISTANRYDTSVNNLQQRQRELTEAQVQLTSGKRVNVASDDPVAAARAERSTALIARSEANQRALEASRNNVQLGESALGDASELLQQAREALVSAGNGSYTAAERQGKAQQLKELRKQLLSVANRADGNGGFVFGGQGSSAPPFLDGPGGVQFVGVGGESQASSSESLSLSVDGSAVWLKGRSGNGVFETGPGTNSLTGAANTGTAWITPGNVSNPSQVPYPATAGNAPKFTIEFAVSGSSTTYTILQDGVAMPAATGVSYNNAKSIEVPGFGMSVSIQGAPANGDTFQIGESTNDLSVFDALDKAINSLTDANLNNGQVQQTVNSGVSRIDALINNVQTARSSLGETLNRMDGIESRISALKLQAQTDRSTAEDLDMVEAISDFQNRQAGYQAALQSYAMVQKLNLFQYIS
ncbi:flagellar hook-associated protein 3 [Aquabacterium lacunae]|uniref:Flagellar hook-associated protein 3 n=1 Tax=Aquabacterium lacunae TaxID=2528630 RepID=A0A4Q9H5J1_9BURK|nr:flagellar hook-associated protein FlgL [Aquabacterium lacunae]TBO32717.1 flagellar hook-associated protein 3 [Aquabacterium lacunae]